MEKHNYLTYWPECVHVSAVIVCTCVTLSNGNMPRRGKQRVVGSNFQELQMAPLLFTTGNRLHRPVDSHSWIQKYKTSNTCSALLRPSLHQLHFHIYYFDNTKGIKKSKLWQQPQKKLPLFCHAYILFLLPQIELILAVGLKLSTKSDIKLPRSCR